MFAIAQDKVFTTGIEGLDKVIGEVRAPYTILVAGHPGAGKTTFASSICYSNTLKGKKCLYIAFYEDRNKLFSYMERLGLHLAEAESRGLLKFMKLPLSLATEEIVELINKTLIEGFDVVVIDSVTALLEAQKEDFTKRAWLLNYFYNLASAINGLTVLVSELPYGEERISADSVEFVVDALFVLKHRVEDRLLVRLLEVRKVRGSSIHVAEMPFIIVENRGIIVYSIPILEGLPEEGGPLDPICRVFREKLGHIHKEFLINVLYPPETIFGLEVFLYLLAIAVKYNFRILTVSYISPPNLLRETIIEQLKALGMDELLAKKLLDKHISFKALNPYAFSIYELPLREIDLIELTKPDIVIFHGTHLVSSLNHIKHLKELFKEVVYLKSKGIGMVRIGNCIDQVTCDVQSSIADLTLRTVRIYEDSGTTYKLVMFRRFSEPIIIKKEELIECIEEAVDFIRKNCTQMDLTR